MKLNKKVIDSIALAALVISMSVTAVTNREIADAQTLASEEQMIANTSLEYDGIAGVTAALSKYQKNAAMSLENRLSVMKQDNVVVTASEDTETEETLTEEEKAWQNNLMPKVEDYLNVRESADENSQVVGKLYKGNLATIVEAGEQWTQITSGNVVGYVRNDYCMAGLEAYEYAKANCPTVATVNTDGLRIREDQSQDSSVISSVSTGDTLTVDTAAETTDEWVAVIYNGSTRYVSSAYVTVELKTGTGVTIEEEQAAIAAAKAEEEARAAKAAKASGSSAKTTTVQNEAVSADVDDVTLLAAIIQCEAGGGSYEGQVAVGAVVLNRVRSSSYPNTISGVIYQRGQFGPASSGKLARRLANGVSDTAYAAAQEALSGVDNTGGCLSFNSLSCGHAGTAIGDNIFW